MRKLTNIFFSIAVMFSAMNGVVYSKTEDCIPESHAPQAHKGPTIALALGGGGTRGAAHLGVLRVLQRENIPIDYIAGSSMGAIVGGLYSAGVPLNHIEKMIDNNKMQKAYLPRRICTSIMLSFVGRIKHLFRQKPYAGIFSGKKFAKFIIDCVPQEKRNIESLDIPFCAVVTNLRDGQAYRLTKGDLGKALLASAAIPPMVRPVEIDGNLFVDGAIRANVPTVPAEQFNPGLIIAVSVDEELKPVDIKNFTSLKSIANRVASIVLTVVDAFHLQKADVAIVPDVSGITILSDNPEDVRKAIKAGEDAAEASLPEIRKAIAQWSPGKRHSGVKSAQAVK